MSRVVPRICRRAALGTHTACARTAFDYRARHLGDLLLGYLGGAVGVDTHRGREDATHQIRPASGGVVIGGVVEALDRHAQRRIPVRYLGIQLLDRSFGEHGPRTDRVVSLFLDVPATGGVE